LFVCVLVGGQAVAQTAGTGPVGKPMQLLQLMHPGDSAAKSHKSAAKHTNKSHPLAKKHALTKLASTESTSNGPPHAAAVDAAAAPPQVSSAPTSESAWATVKAIRADIRNHQGARQMQAIRTDMSNHLGAAIQAIVAQNAAAVTLLPSSAIAQPSELAIDRQTFRVASVDDANEIDRSTKEQSAPVTDALVAIVPAMKATITETAAPADPSGAAAASQTPDSNVSSTSWMLRVMGALGTAVAVGTVAWFLIGPAPLRRVSAPSVVTPA
jgi:hypothetical protein